MSDGVTLRPMHRDDIGACLALEKILYPIDAWSLGQFIEELSGVPVTRHYVVIVDGSEIVGYAGLMCPYVGADGDVQTLSVAPHRQGEGLGQLLLNDLLAEAIKRKSPSLFLEVRVDNEAALGLYGKNGFEITGRRRNYYGPGVDATTMRKVLTP
jgi:[ribosomal protein S18]-alanine N-acetyltransferase